jgi:hypothetical protein
VLSGLVQVRASHGFCRPHEPEEPDREAGQEKLRFSSATPRMGGHPGRVALSPACSCRTPARLHEAMLAVA